MTGTDTEAAPPSGTPYAIQSGAATTALRGPAGGGTFGGGVGVGVGGSGVGVAVGPTCTDALVVSTSCVSFLKKRKLYAPPPVDGIGNESVADGAPVVGGVRRPFMYCQSSKF